VGRRKLTTTRDHNFLLRNVRAEISAAHTPRTPHRSNGCSTSYLNQLVPNPFQPLFCQVPGSLRRSTTPASLTIRRKPACQPAASFPQSRKFHGASEPWSEYHSTSMQIRFQKTRGNHFLSFEVTYTLSKATDDSSTGSTHSSGSLKSGNVQQLDRLKQSNAISR